MTTNGIRQVQRYDNILEALQRALPSSVHIAGGAVRDTILERPIKDVDVFLHHTAGEAAAALLRTKFGCQGWRMGAVRALFGPDASARRQVRKGR
jgi:tRNA nucleotidyltransferase/poly(A) polymerase